MGLRFRILGTLEVTDGDGAVPVAGRRRRALLALFLLRPNEVLSSQRIAEIVWPDQSLLHPANVVQATVSRLRGALSKGGGSDADCRLTTCPGGYAFVLPEGRLDLTTLEELTRRARDANAAGAAGVAVELLREAVGLWRGTPLAEFAGDPFFEGEQARLQELFMTAIEERVEAELALGRHRLLIPELRALVAEHPMRERLWASLMLALVRAGRQLDALDAYTEMRTRVMGEFGLEPGEKVRALQRSILAQDRSLDAPALAAGRTSVEPMTALIGREQDVAEVSRLLLSSRVRLVTLSGAGGIGKSRLARAVAGAAEPAFPGGAQIVEAGSATDESALALAIAEQLAVETGAEGGVLGSVVAHLRHGPTLLVLDNVEQVLPDVGLLPRLLADVPDLTLLVTSRVALRLSGEHEFVVSALDTPPPDAGLNLDEVALYPASALFLERCGAVSRRFRPAPDEASVIAEICGRLDGVPLALELAAACVKMLSLEEILERLDDSLGLLTRGRLDAPERQQTMRATVEWSYRLLGPAEQELIARLAVFAGGWTLGSATAVCEASADVVGGLTKLLDANLVWRADAPTGGRFDMLEPVRDFARERLDELADADETRDRHAAHFAEALYGHVTSGLWPDYADIDAIARELGNLRAALAWSSDGRAPDEAVLLACALASLCRVRGHVEEARRWLEAALADCGEIPVRTRAAALAGLAGLAMAQDELAAGEALLLEVLALDELEKISPGEVCSTLAALAWIQVAQCKSAKGLELVERARLAAIESADELDLAHTVHIRGLVLAEVGRLEEGMAALEEALQRFRQLDMTRGIVGALTNLSVIKICLGDLDAAEELIVECVELAGRNADAALHSCAASNLAIVSLLRGDLDRTAAQLDDALRRNELLVDRRGLIENVLVAGAASACVGQWTVARTLHAASMRLHRDVGFQVSPSERLLLDLYFEATPPADETPPPVLTLEKAVAYARESLAAIAELASETRQVPVGLL